MQMMLINIVPPSLLAILSLHLNIFDNLGTPQLVNFLHSSRESWGSLVFDFTKSIQFFCFFLHPISICEGHSLLKSSRHGFSSHHRRDRQQLPLPSSRLSHHRPSNTHKPISRLQNRRSLIPVLRLPPRRIIHRRRCWCRTISSEQHSSRLIPSPHPLHRCDYGVAERVSETQFVVERS